MTRQFIGARSLDAEITLDFENNDILMDYRLNELGSPYDSNNSVTVKDEFLKMNLRQRMIRLIYLLLYFAYSIVTVAPLTFLTHRGLIKNKQYQIEHQKILRDLITGSLGKNVRTVRGPLQERIISFPMQTNIWMNYALEGEYKNQIRKISLKRKFSKRVCLGMERVKQQGWILIFEFWNAPRSGSMLVEWV